jgi:acyl-CoA reductase-like NAD-dependent aldehyde dehydrogenase
MLLTMRTQLYIDGQWVDGIGKIPVYDPSDGSVIAEVSLAGDVQCEAAIAAADAAAKAWAKTAPRYRSEILRKAFELMTAENEAIATLISREKEKQCQMHAEKQHMQLNFSVGLQKKQFGHLVISVRAHQGISESL